MEKYKITVERIVDGKTEIVYQDEYAKEEVNIKEERFLDPRYEPGRFEPAGFWDSGHSVEIKAAHMKINPEPL